MMPVGGDPVSTMISGGFTAVGIGLDIFGGMKAKSDEAKISGLQNQVLSQEQSENDVRQQAVALQAQRKQIQNVRNVQMAASAQRASAVSGGAQFGSGAKAGQEQAFAQGAYNQKIIGQDLQQANQMFSIDRNINSLKQQIGNAQTSLANDQSLMNIGNALMGGASAAGNVGSTGFNFLKS